MDKNKYLIMIDDKDKTEEIEEISSEIQPKIGIKFYNNDRVYSYGKNKVSILENPKEIEITSCLVYLDGSYLSNIIKMLDFQSYIKISYQNGREKAYKRDRITFEKNILTNQKANHVLEKIRGQVIIIT